MDAGVLLQQVAEQIVVRVNVRILLQAPAPVRFEGFLGLDVRDTAHTGVHTEAEVIAILQSLVQILIAHHAQLVPNRLSPADHCLDAGIAVAVFLTGHHADLQRVGSGGNRLKEGLSVLQFHHGVAGKNPAGREMHLADVQHIHRHIPDGLFRKIGVQVESV